jgi:uncharacterized membrane protein
MTVKTLPSAEHIESSTGTGSNVPHNRHSEQGDASTIVTTAASGAVLGAAIGGGFGTILGGLFGAFVGSKVITSRD